MLLSAETRRPATTSERLVQFPGDFVTFDRTAFDYSKNAATWMLEPRGIGSYFGQRATQEPLRAAHIEL
jgi:hypothetical protein